MSGDARPDDLLSAAPVEERNEDRSGLRAALLSALIVSIGGAAAAQPLSAPWANTDIGNPAIAGRATESRGVFTVVGALISADLGKPKPDVNNEITSDQATLFTTPPIGNYLATLTAIGPGAAAV